MTRAIRKHLVDFVALIGLFLLAIVVGGYILSNQRLRFPIVDEKPFSINAEFSDAQAVIPGQGQTVRIAGVRVGDIGAVDLKDGKAVVRLDLDKEYEDRIHADAAALLRPKSGLKDMFIQLDPGTKAAKTLDSDDVIPVQNTAPDIDPDEVLSALDVDTRAYLKLLVNGLGDGLRGRSDDLREVFKRLEPLHRDVARVSTAVASRRKEMARLIHNYGLLMEELGDKDKELTRLVQASNRTFAAFASEDQAIATAVNRLPGALGQTATTLAKVDTLSDELGPTLESLRPAFRQLDTANREVLPLVREAEPQIRTRIRPFVRAARPFVRDLRPAAIDLARAMPDLKTSFNELNRFFNMLAYNKGGREKVTGNLAQDKERDEGYLFWLAWLAQNGNSLFSMSDASGPFRKVMVQATCTTLVQSFVNEEPAAAPLLGLDDVLADASICPETAGRP